MLPSLSLHVLVPFLFLVACSKESVTSYSYTHSDSAIRGPSYAAIAADMKKLEREYPDLVAVTTYGKSMEDRDLNVVKIGLNVSSEQTTQERQAVLITGATHGNEYLNIEDRLPRWFAENQNAEGVSRFLHAGGIIYIVPIFNPDGYERRERENRLGTDLNRDFDIIPAGKMKFGQPETKAFTSYLDDEIRAHSLNLKVTLDYHCCMGALVYPWGYTQEPLPQQDLVNHIAIANVMDSIFRNYAHGATFELLGYLSEGSSKDYYFSKYGALAFTFEGVVGSENQNLGQHTQWWDRMLGDLIP